ncbi:ribosomal protein L18 [Peptostreptococcus anaerobius]|uniref:Large ribosomal subunit protein uL18 n=1 Tax=Peptostreptococcus anaerobius TaxID=1261 RepID=A0A135YUQ6_9FIRM|nr:ribosomal protein L18 [Peptostreptococcus anaerobius VPI 4330 = DSM 2949]KXB73287.1 ribosomal protein L18 [Peptostreptococcus anaerobius]KXI13114.1 ribosomal protein L18 [Peptostreptococcus anaerobius]
MSTLFKKIDKNANRVARHKRVRKKVTGTAERPRLCVFRSSKNIYAQIIDDANRVTLVSASSLDEAIKGAVSYTGNKEAARKVGELVAKKAAEKGITEVVFDRGGYIYHGRVLELAEGAREAGLKF